ncbi:RidA family protein [Pikeienuella piscinae]|uniref:RidA family protein n=1 Tax=Pikeienuella piscinae TaxID=2748098 RepID=A0A7L5BUD3_9RHOB|nr:RidA family protein [Pikeienuella piscinae]QIE55212.1 RidA family protein [Pikeienuella piscinae]
MSHKVEYVNPPGTAPAQGLYSHVGVPTGGRLVFIAGQLSVSPDGDVVGAGDFAAQFHQVFANMGDVLKGMGGGYPDIVKMTTIFVHSQDIATFMRLREALFPTIFPGPLFPPNTILVVDRLVKEDFLFEVEAVAQIAA